MTHALPQGFTAAGIAAGIKKHGKKDMGLIKSEVPASAAAVFTKNRVQAAPVLLDRKRISAGKAQAIVVNSGNANCCTGDRGAADALETTRRAAEALGVEESLVLIASTGVIGEPLPMDRIRAGVTALVDALSAEGLGDFAEAIMTTDTVPKVISRRGDVKGVPYSLCATAKGAGMIRPDMATMLCFVVTDAAVGREVLQSALRRAVDRSFNRITIDGDTSTNDTVLLLANGRSGARVIADDDVRAFNALLEDVLVAMAKELVRDGEGATKLVEILVRGAMSDEDARAVAETVAHSSLVKTALFGEDANWGRILAAAGRSGAELDPDRVEVRFDDVPIFSDGKGCGNDVEAEATRVLKKPEFAISIDLGLGEGAASMITCDFSVDYVRINADYRS